MDQNNQNDIEKIIKSKSTKDCIDGLPPLSMGGAFIPAQLSDILNNKVKPFSGMTEIHAQYYAIVSGLAGFDYTKLNEQNYWYLWKLLLYIEYHQYIKDMEQYSLFNQKLQVSEKRPDEFLVAVPGLMEDRPSLREFDQIELMQVNGKNQCVGIVTHVGKDYVSVDVPSTFRYVFTQDQIFNIAFRVDDWTAKCWNYILDVVDKENITPMLFPSAQSSSCLTADGKKVNWINKTIESNPEQQQAVLNIMNKTSHTAPYILFGPPGTGKTSTLVETICQIVKKNSSTKILICTPSNAAADEIAERLLKNSGFVEDDFMYRMYSLSRSSDDVKPELKTFSNFADRKTVFVSKEVFMTKKIVVTTLATCIRLHGYKLRENYFSYLFIDEAGQATEIDTLIPLALMCGKDSTNASKFTGQIVIAGDPQQLGPTVQSKIAEPLLGRSMLERLMSWPLYTKRNKYNPQYVTKLIQNYRCHKAILTVPNNLFYEGELKAMGGKHTTRAVNWPSLPRSKFPVIFHAIRGKEGRKKFSPSVYNEREISQVISYVKKLLKTKLDGKIVKPEDIGIVTPYKLQRNMIHKALEYNNLGNVPVGTVEIFQGQEKDIIIITTVRSVIYKTEENKFHIGFLSNPKRFNVAITRAKSLLIVVGHPDILQLDYCWREFVKYCVENKACHGEKFSFDESPSDLDIRKTVEGKYCRELLRAAPKKIVEEDSESSKQQEINFRDLPRRRRVPSGPVSSYDRYSSNKIQELMMNLDNEYHQQLQLDEDPLSDDSADSEYSADENDQLIDAEEQFVGNGCMAKDIFADYLKKLSAEEDQYEMELENRMKVLAIDS